MDHTRVQQNGSVRSYIVNAGSADGWALQIDMADRQLLRASLSSRDGREFTCETSTCQGQATLGRATVGSAASLRLLRLRLLRTSAPDSRAPVAGAEPLSGSLIIQASLRIPAEDQLPGLACTGPSVAISSADGSVHRFCGQGGSGIELADDGQRHYRFQDHEGRTLAIAIDKAERVVGVSMDQHACIGSACTGASSSSAEPGNDLAERSFFFGRTPLFEGGRAGSQGATRPPARLLEGTIVMPAQQ